MVTIVVSIVAAAATAAAAMMVNIVHGIKPDFIINGPRVHHSEVNSQVRLLHNFHLHLLQKLRSGFYAMPLTYKANTSTRY